MPGWKLVHWECVGQGTFSLRPPGGVATPHILPGCTWGRLASAGATSHLSQVSSSPPPTASPPYWSPALGACPPGLR